MNPYDRNILLKKMGGLKSEARSTNFETSTNVQNTKFKTFLFKKFENLDFGFVSDFDIRFSDF